MGLTLYMGHRLEVYLDIYVGLAPSLATRNFRKALVSLYGPILGFLAHALRIQDRSGFTRLLCAPWNSNDLEKFEAKCDILAGRASEKAKLCERELDEQWRAELSSYVRDL